MISAGFQCWNLDVVRGRIKKFLKNFALALGYPIAEETKFWVLVMAP